MHKYDLIALDIDGTLLTSQNTIPPALYSLFREVEARGIGITLISGRPELTVAPLMRELSLTLPCISSGGAQISDSETGETLAAFTLKREEVQALAEMGRAAGVGLIAMEARRLYYEGRADKFQFVHESVEIRLNNVESIKTPIIQVEDIVQASPNPLKFTFSGPPEMLAPVEERLRASTLPLYFTHSLPIYLEATSSQANKGAALRLLAGRLNIPLERVLVIGDSPNDISMFKVAGMAVAMGNATPDVKSAAHLIAPSNDEDGVAWVLRKLLQ